ncbi:hypothetical protein BIV57_01175 [Mangrovactinospora gilvigrisea]|uniref:Uncharacterized protein n=1 Tax=Mangrovactinospora gilvigrisea TaxID=1428644 RepID=A0A1J7BL93_9ACTN|nr:DUF6325 family protein [Mangrovactinospora gilvigrisea]OIV39475.1 hypothetical protein BIV57_01175 [Mangrovactinospora gilvigrisea]
MDPVQFLVLAFPGKRPTRQAMAEVTALQFGGRVIDTLLVSKDLYGEIHTVEAVDLPDLHEVAYGPDIVHLIGPDDAKECAALLEPGQCALLALIEHRWSARMVRAVQEDHARLAASTCIPVEHVEQARTALVAAQHASDRLFHRPERPIARSAIVRPTGAPVNLTRS